MGVVATAAIASAAPTSQPATPAPSAASQVQPKRELDPVKPGPYEQLAIRTGAKGPPAASQPASLSATAQADSHGGAFDTTRVIGALAAVIGLIFLLRWLAKGLFASSAAPRAGSGAMRVLSRMVVSPKQQVLLVQIGRRVVVVGDCGTQMSPLSEITDPDEIAALVGQISQDQSRPAMKGFGALFGRAQGPFKVAPAASRPDEEHDDANVEEPDEPTSAMTGEIAGLMEKIRNVSSQFRPQ